MLRGFFEGKEADDATSFGVVFDAIRELIQPPEVNQRTIGFELKRFADRSRVPQPAPPFCLIKTPPLFH